MKAALEAIEVLDARHVLLETVNSARAKLGELIIRMADRQKEAREAAANESSVLGLRAAVPTLRRLSEDDKSAEVREAATRSLGWLCDQQLVPRWILALERDNAADRERRAAAAALGACGDSRGVLALLALLENGDAPELVGAAAHHFPVVAVSQVLDVFERKPELAKRQANVSLMMRCTFAKVAPLLTKRLEAAREKPDYVAKAALYLKLAGGIRQPGQKTRVYDRRRRGATDG